ncbi:MAG: hypothetical protein MZV65_31095 [Chromatiales bacterium]|nr:hypothetical protein [Chromatiales bacterium]
MLGHTAGNALEVREAIALSEGVRPGPAPARAGAGAGQRTVVPRRAGRRGSRPPQTHLQAALDGGRAAERCAAMVRALGGPAELLDQPERFLPQAPVVAAALAAPRTVTVQRMDTRALGLAVVGLGGGRRRASDSIDPAVGLSDLCPVGAWVDRQRPLALVHARREDQAQAASAALQAAIAVGDAAPPPRPLIHERWGGPD